MGTYLSSEQFEGFLSFDMEAFQIAVSISSIAFDLLMWVMRKILEKEGNNKERDGDGGAWGIGEE